mgnify:CR=1 FL=1
MKDEVIIPLVKRAKKGDSKAFEGLLNEIYDEIFKMAFYFSGNKTDAEDITQSACIKLAGSIESFQNKSAFSTWLYRIVINCGHDHYRINQRHQTSKITDNTTSGNEQPDSQAYSNEIFEMIAKLPEAERISLILVFVKGLTHAGAADIMNCKESTVSWYIHEARKKLAPFWKGGMNNVRIR